MGICWKLNRMNKFNLISSIFKPPWVQYLFFTLFLFLSPHCSCLCFLHRLQFPVSSTLPLRTGCCCLPTTPKSMETICTVCGLSSRTLRAGSIWPSMTSAWKNSLTSSQSKMAERYCQIKNSFYFHLIFPHISQEQRLSPEMTACIFVWTGKSKIKPTTLFPFVLFTVGAVYLVCHSLHIFAMSWSCLPGRVSHPGHLLGWRPTSSHNN